MNTESREHREAAFELAMKCKPKHRAQLAHDLLRSILDAGDTGYDQFRASKASGSYMRKAVNLLAKVD